MPEVLVGVRDGRYWVTQLTFDDGALTEAGALAALERWLSSGGTGAADTLGAIRRRPLSQPGTAPPLP